MYCPHLPPLPGGQARRDPQVFAKPVQGRFRLAVGLVAPGLVVDGVGIVPFRDDLRQQLHAAFDVAGGTGLAGFAPRGDRVDPRRPACWRQQHRRQQRRHGRSDHAGHHLSIQRLVMGGRFRVCDGRAMRTSGRRRAGRTLVGRWVPALVSSPDRGAGLRWLRVPPGPLASPALARARIVAGARSSAGAAIGVISAAARCRWRSRSRESLITDSATTTTTASSGGGQHQPAQSPRHRAHHRGDLRHRRRPDRAARGCGRNADRRRGENRP